MSDTIARSTEHSACSHGKRQAVERDLDNSWGGDNVEDEPDPNEQACAFDDSVGRP